MVTQNKTWWFKVLDGLLGNMLTWCNVLPQHCALYWHYLYYLYIFIIVQQVWWCCLCHLRHLGLPNVSKEGHYYFSNMSLLLNVDEIGSCCAAGLKVCVISIPFLISDVIQLIGFRRNLSHPLIHHSLSSHLPPAGFQKSRHCLQMTPRTGIINSPLLSDDAACAVSFKWP